MPVARRAQSDSKQEVRMNLGMKLIGKNLGMKLNFYFWLDIHKSVWLIWVWSGKPGPYKSNSK